MWGSAATLPLFSSYAAGAMRRPELMAVPTAMSRDCEADRPLREPDPMGEGLRDAVVFLVVTS